MFSAGKAVIHSPLKCIAFRSKNSAPTKSCGSTRVVIVPWVTRSTSEFIVCAAVAVSEKSIGVISGKASVRQVSSSRL